MVLGQDGHNPITIFSTNKLLEHFGVLTLLTNKRSSKVTKKYFLTKTFLNKSFFGPLIFFQTTTFFRPKKISSQTFFRQKYLSVKKKFQTKHFFRQKINFFFQNKIFFSDISLFLDHTLFRTNFFLQTKLFSDQAFFRTKIISDKNNFGSKIF